MFNFYINLELGIGTQYHLFREFSTCHLILKPVDINCREALKHTKRHLVVGAPGGQSYIIKPLKMPSGNTSATGSPGQEVLYS